MLSFAAIVPQPTRLIPKTGEEKIEAYPETIKALKTLRAELEEKELDTLIILSAHGPIRYDKFTINLENKLIGDFSNFGAEKNNDTFFNNLALAKKFLQSTRSKHLPVDLIRETNLDYGTYLSLNYLISEKIKKPKVIPLTSTNLDYKINYRFGKIIGEKIKNSSEKIGIVVSGDLSHRTSKQSIAGFSPYGEKFDKTLIRLLENNDNEKVLGLNPDFTQEVHETILNNTLVCLGALNNIREYFFEKLSYEAPFGVGHLVGKWEIRST